MHKFSSSIEVLRRLLNVGQNEAKTFQVNDYCFRCSLSTVYSFNNRNYHFRTAECLIVKKLQPILVSYVTGNSKCGIRSFHKIVYGSTFYC
jgi:hypothetical protein